MPRPRPASRDEAQHGRRNPIKEKGMVHGRADAGTEAGISFGVVKTKKPRFRVSSPLPGWAGRGRSKGGADEALPSQPRFPIRRRFDTMLKRFLTTLFLVVAVLGLATGANAQYMRIVTDNPADSTRMRTTGTTILTIRVDTNHDKSGITQTCNSHQVAAGCPFSVGTAQPLDMFGYTIALKAVGGTVQFGTFTASDANYTNSSPQIQNDTEVEVNQFRPTGTFTPPGPATLGTIPVTPLTGSPAVNLKVGYSQPTDLNPAGFGTGFATECDGTQNFNYYIVGDPLDPCRANPSGPANGLAGDWFDWDGAKTAAGGNNAPSITANPTSATATEGTAMSPISATATDLDASDILTITQSGMPADLVFTHTPGVSPRSATISGTPGFNDAGTYTIAWTVSDGHGGTASASTSLTVNNTNRPPTLTQPSNMTVNEGTSQDQVLSGTDPDGDNLAFALVSGPSYVVVTQLTPTTANARVAPGFNDSGTATATVRATDTGALSDQKSFSITVNNVDRPVSLAAIANMTVTAGATADQAFTASDPDGDAITFTHTGPTFMTRTDNAQAGTTRTGNVHLAPSSTTSGTFAASVTAASLATTSPRSFTITVTPAANSPPTLNQPANMTVNEGQTANQTITGTDPDGNALSFSKTSGPTYMTVTTTTPGTGTGAGNIALAPGFSDAGTATATVRVTDTGALFNEKSLTITVNNVNRAPVLAQPANMTVNENATADQALSATDADGNALTFSLGSGPSYATVTTTTPGTGTGTGNLHLAPGFNDSGTAPASVSVNDGAGGTDAKSLTITVNNVNRAPVLAQPANMTVNEGATASQALSATDADGQALSFTKAAGPTYATVTTTSPGTGTAAGNLALAPGFSDSGTATISISVSDGAGGTDAKSLTVTVNNVDRPVSLAPIANMSVVAGATNDQTFTATDPDGDAITFTHTGPTFMTRTDNAQAGTTRTGNVHLAPTSTTSGSFAASVTATSLATNDTKSFTISVTVVNNAPTLAQPANMTVNEGQTANQTLTATDPDGNSLSFSKASGPTYATVTTTSPGTGTAAGNLALAPGFSDSGTATISISVSDGAGGTDAKSLTVTVNNVNRNPVLAQPANMTVNEGATANQALSATDADGDGLSFTKAVGPTYATVTTTTPGTGTGAGNLALAPGFSDSGTATISISVSDGAGGTDAKSLTVTVNNVNRAPVLAQPANMTVNENATASQALSATDADGQALRCSKGAGPTHATVTTNSPGK